MRSGAVNQIGRRDQDRMVLAPLPKITFVADDLLSRGIATRCEGNENPAWTQNAGSRATQVVRISEMLDDMRAEEAIDLSDQRLNGVDHLDPQLLSRKAGAGRNDFIPDDGETGLLELSGPVSPRAAEIKNGGTLGEAGRVENFDVSGVIFLMVRKRGVDEPFQFLFSGKGCDDTRFIAGLVKIIGAFQITFGDAKTDTAMGTFAEARHQPFAAQVACIFAPAGRATLVGAKEFPRGRDKVSYSIPHNKILAKKS